MTEMTDASQNDPAPDGSDRTDRFAIAHLFRADMNAAKSDGSDAICAASPSRPRARVRHRTRISQGSEEVPTRPSRPSDSERTTEGPEKRPRTAEDIYRERIFRELEGDHDHAFEVPDPPADLDPDAREWRGKLLALAARVTRQKDLRHIETAINFIDGGWATKAIALGWSEIELFGVSRVKSDDWYAVNYGIAFESSDVSSLTADKINYAYNKSMWQGFVTEPRELVWESNKPNLF